MTFDATSRELCTVRRVRTNTPLQALTMLNDEAFFEAARALAGRMTLEGGTTAPARAAYGFRLVTSRTPTPAETSRIVTSYEKQLAHFRAHPGAAERVVSGAAEAKSDAGNGRGPKQDRSSRQTASSRQLPAASRGGSIVVERAAWTLVANALLNLDEAVNK
jgi:hypothetical protein